MASNAKKLIINFIDKKASNNWGVWKTKYRLTQGKQNKAGRVIWHTAFHPFEILRSKDAIFKFFFF